MDKYPKYLSQEQQERFERYLLGTMADSERTDFESELREDPSFREAFTDFKALFDTVEEAGLRAQLDDFHRTLVQSGTPIHRLDPARRSFNYRIAATVALLLTVGGIWFFNRTDPDEKLFRSHYSPDPGLPTVMGSSDNYAFYEAMVDYKQGEYALAITKWEKLLAKKPENDTLNYFLGNAHLAQGDAGKSLPLLERVARNNRSSFYQEALYYLGLSYLKTGQKEKANTVLGRTTDARASRLINELREAE